MRPLPSYGRQPGEPSRPLSDRPLRDVARLRASLPSQLPRLEKPALVVVSGLPGSGKSYFSRRVAARFPLALLESDALRKVLVPSPTYSGPESGRLFRAIHVLIHGLLSSGAPVLLDATNLVEAYRKRLYRIARRLDVPILLVHLEAPEGIVYQRLERRQQGLDPANNSDAGPDVYERMKPRAEPIRREHLAVDTSGDITPAVECVVEWLRYATARPRGERPSGMQ